MSYLVPAKITAGLDVTWDAVVQGYNPAEWSLDLVLRGASAIDVAAATAGSAYRFTIPADQTAGLTPGRYRWAVIGTNSGRQVEVDRGMTEVLPDLRALAAGHDPRTHAEKVLETIEAVLENRATIEQRSYKINNRELSRTPVGELVQLRQRYRQEVAGERAAARGVRTLGRVHLARFTS